MSESSTAKEEEVSEVDDPWAPQKGKRWSEMTVSEKILKVTVAVCFFMFLPFLLYIFICSLDILRSAFLLLGGKAAGKLFLVGEIYSNPIAALMVGILATMLLQSPLTAISVAAFTTGSGILPITPAIFIMMGANIGTCVTNTIVSLAHVINRNEFRRAFAAATVHDLFNWLSVLILFPVEWISGSIGKWKDCGILCQISKKIIQKMDISTLNEFEMPNEDWLRKITRPLTDRIIQVNRRVVTLIATWDETVQNIPLAEANLEMVPRCYEDVKYYYIKEEVYPDYGFNDNSVENTFSSSVSSCGCDRYEVAYDKEASAYLRLKDDNLIDTTTSSVSPSCRCVLFYNFTEESVGCGYLFDGVVGIWTEAEIGLLLLVLTLLVIIVCQIVIGRDCPSHQEIPQLQCFLDKSYKISDWLHSHPYWCWSHHASTE